MEYIERYIYQVKRLIPEKEKEDVANELRELLEEEVRAKQAGDLSPDVLEKNQLAVLKNFGAPESMAIEYGGGYAPLVPAVLMPQFIKVLKLMGVIHLALFLIRAIFTDNFLSGFGSLFTNLLITFAIVVLIFYLIGKDEKSIKSTWKPESLPPVQTTSEVKQGELLFSITFNSFFVIFILLLPEWITLSEEQSQIPWMRTFYELKVYVPFAVFILFGSILLDMFTLIKRSWTPILRAGNIALDVLWILLVMVIFQIGLDLSFDTLLDDLPSKFISGSWIVANILLGSVVVALIDIISHSVKWINSRR